MRYRACLALMFGIATWSSPAAAFEPTEVRVTPELEALYAGFFPAEIFKVTDGVYVARGYNRDNPVLIVGPSGLIVVDPGESREAGEIVRHAYNTSEAYPELRGIFDRKPVRAIIYTHHHDCHIHGAAAFAGPHTEIIAHANLMTTLFYDWYSQLYPGRLVGGTMMSGALFAHDSRWFYGGGLFATQVRGESGFIPPTRLVSDTLKTDLAGVRITFFSVPGETRDVLLTWLPDKKLLVQIANLYEAMPAITTLRGAYPRNALDYVASIDFYRTLDAEYLVLPHGPRPFFAGKDTVERIFRNYRDGIQFIHDQTVQYMNKGFTPGEIKERIHLPPHLASEPFLQEVYGDIARNVYEIFWWYRGQFSGDVRHLFARSPLEDAEMASLVAGKRRKPGWDPRQAILFIYLWS